MAVTVAVLLGFAGPVLAEEGQVCPVCSRASAETASYPSKAGNTLVRGAANTLLGWTELIRQPASEVKGGGNVVVGLGKGVGHTVKRTLAGIGEVLTFWTPKLQGSYVHFANDCPLCVGKQ
jgi:putative exosortase-associated protein (TIGR04073 family)